MTSSTIAPPWALDARQAVQAIRSGRLKAVDYVTALLARADTYSSLHAFISLETESAIAAASRIDALTDNERASYPLAGLPIAVKANINVKGTRTCAGTPALAGFVAPTTAPTVTRLVEAGAIVLGKTNMHELAVGITSTNLAAHAGPVRNPYDRSKIPGGSSGGTAAALAARIVPAGLGTDTGGSTRIPAALTGTAGLRPSVGNGGAERRYRNEHDVVPISHTRDTVGPMARTAADLAFVDGIATGDTALPAIELARLRIGLPRDCWRQLDSTVEAIAHAARERLEQAGVTFVDVELTEIMSICERISLPIAFAELGDDVPAWLVANGAPVQTLGALAERIASPDVRRIYEATLAGTYAEAYPHAIQVLRPELQRRYASIFDTAGLDALLFPTTPLPAVDIDHIEGSAVVTIGNGEPIDEMAAYLRHTDPASVAGIPGLSIPGGLTPSGLPVGIEIDGPLGSDRRLLAIGIAFESVLGALPPPF